MHGDPSQSVQMGFGLKQQTYTRYKYKFNWRKIQRNNFFSLRHLPRHLPRHLHPHPRPL